MLPLFTYYSNHKPAGMKLCEIIRVYLCAPFLVAENYFGRKMNGGQNMQGERQIEKNEIITKSETMISKPKIPLVFISHDTRDYELAECFSRLLSSVSAGVLKSFRSSDKKGSQGIEYGVEWFPEIMKKLDDASDVVCLLTKHSVDRPWILYEAGVAKGKLNTKLLGVSIGISLNIANNGPFAQFQNCADDEDSLSKLIMQLVKRVPNSEPDIDVIKAQVNVFLIKAKEIVSNLPEISSSETKGKNDGLQEAVAKLFEEIKLMYSELPARIGKRIQPENSRLRFARINPGMIEELLYTFRNKNTGFLIALSLLKNDFPWLFEMGNDLIKLSKRRSGIELKKAVNDFRNVLEFTFEHPMMRDNFRNSKVFREFRECYYIFMKYIERMLMDNNFEDENYMDAEAK